MWLGHIVHIITWREGALAEHTDERERSRATLPNPTNMGRLGMVSVVLVDGLPVVSCRYVRRMRVKGFIQFERVCMGKDVRHFSTRKFGGCPRCEGQRRSFPNFRDK